MKLTWKKVLLGVGIAYGLYVVIGLMGFIFQVGPKSDALREVQSLRAEQPATVLDDCRKLMANVEIEPGQAVRTFRKGEMATLPASISRLGADQVVVGKDSVHIYFGTYKIVAYKNSTQGAGDYKLVDGLWFISKTRE